MGIKDLLKKRKAEAKSGDIYKEPTTAGSFEKDERFWNIGKKDDNTGSAVIRLLPSLNTEEDNLNTYVIQKVHSINTSRVIGDKKDDRWSGSLVCPRTEGKLDEANDCPICKQYWSEWKEMDTQGVDRQLISKKIGTFSAKDKLFTNALIMNDPVNPENNGKIKIVEVKRSWLKLFEKENERIQEILENNEHLKATDLEEYKTILANEGIPEDVEYLDAFDLMNGKKLNLKYIPKGHDKWKDNDSYWGFSSIDRNFSVLCDTDEKAEAVMSKCFNLDEFSKPSTFKDSEGNGPKAKIPTLEKLSLALQFVNFEITREEYQSGNVIKPVQKETVQEDVVLQNMKKEEVLETQIETVQEEVQNEVQDSDKDFLDEILETKNEPVPEPEVQETKKEEVKQDTNTAISDDDFFVKLGIDV